MKVLYFSRAYTVHDQRFLNAIAGAGHRVFFLHLESGKGQKNEPSLPESVEKVVWAGGQKPFSWWMAPRLMKSLRVVIDELQPDLLHAGPLTTAAVLAARSGFRPLIQMSWGSDILWEARRNPLSGRLVRYALGSADALIADCQAVAQSAMELGFREEHIVAFPWGVDLKRFAPSSAKSALRENLGWQDKFVLLHMRNWESIYGVENVARAFAQAAQDDAALRLLMPGSGSLADSIKIIFRKADVLDRVHFAGQVAQQELPGYYQAADLYISGSLSDGSSVSLMEALASGRPVLLSDIPGNREWITPGKEGWLFSLDDVDALAAAIIRARQQHANFPKMQRLARRKAEERADWTQNQKGISRAYELAMRQN